MGFAYVLRVGTIIGELLMLFALDLRMDIYCYYVIITYLNKSSNQVLVTKTD